MELIQPAVSGNIRILVTTRTSNKKFGGFNLATHVDDHEATVLKNRQQLQQHLELGNSPVWLEQTHSNQIVEVNEPPQLPAPADASYTTKRTLPLAILTADCLPIVLWSDKEVAIVHAGWRGLANGILANSLALFEGRVSAWIGPGIGPCHYEVDENVATHFTDRSAFRPSREGHYWFDLQEEAALQLGLAGVREVQKLSVCTFCDSRLYSYRRDGETGRFATLAWLP